MVSVIKLWPGQNQAAEFDHPLLDYADSYKLTKEEYKMASMEEKKLSYMWLVRRIVGRYLYHWPSTKFLLDDMVSTGLLTLCSIEDLSNQKRMMNRIQEDIEVMLNNNRSIVSACLRTNKSRQAENKELEYNKIVSIHNIGKEDERLLQAELLDGLSEQDRQKVIEANNE